MKKNFTLLFVLLIILQSARAQEPLPIIKRTYLSNDNKLYINKDLGVYLWLSNSADPNSVKLRLFSDSTKDYTNPMYFDARGFNSIRSPWAVDTSTKKTVYPLRDIVFEVYADGAPPVSKTIFISKSGRIIQGNKYFGPDLAIKISSVDEFSGVNSIFYSLNGQAFSEYKEELKSFKEGENILKYYSTDNVGNIEEVKEKKFYFDNTLPKTE